MLSAIVVPMVTCDLPVSPVHHDPKREYLSDLQLADPTYGQPGKTPQPLQQDIQLYNAVDTFTFENTVGSIAQMTDLEASYITEEWTPPVVKKNKPLIKRTVNQIKRPVGKHQ